MDIKQIRKQYPQYNDMSDEQLANALHQKYYSDLPKEQVFEKLGYKPEPNAEQNLAYIKEHHPILTKLAKHFAGSPALEKAGNIAEKFNIGVEGTGLPNFARGFFQTGSDTIRGAGNLIPGVNIPNPHFSETPIREVNPALQRTMDLLGNVFGYVPAAVAQEGIQGLKALGKVPSAVRSIGTGAGIGAAISPEERGMGAIGGAIGGAIPAAFETIQKLKTKNNPIQAIQNKHYNKVRSASDKFNFVANAAKDLGISRMPIKKELFSEIEKKMPDKKSIKLVLDKAKSGDYQDIRDLQSSMFEQAKKHQASDNVADQNLGDHLMELRDELNSDLKQHLINEDAPQLANTLQEAMNEWRKINELYGKNRAVAKLVGPDKHEQKNIMEVLQEKSEPMKLFRLHHPEIEQSIKYEKYDKQMKKGLKYLSAIPAFSFLKYMMNG